MSFNSDEWTGESKQSKYGVNRIWLPNQIGDSIVVRFLPPVGNMRNPWSYYKLHKVEFQTIGYDRPSTRRLVCLDQFITYEERQKRTKIENIVLSPTNVTDPDVRKKVAFQIEMLRDRCPLDSLAKQLELNYFTAKAEGQPKVVVDVLWKRFMDAQGKGLYFYNVVDKNGNHAILEAKSHVHSALIGAVKQKATEAGLNIFSLKDNGVWVKISKVSVGQKTGNFSIELNEVTKNVNGEMMRVYDKTLITPEVQANLSNVAIDLTHFYDNSTISKKEAMQIFMGEPIPKSESSMTLPKQATPSATTYVPPTPDGVISSGYAANYEDEDMTSLDDLLDL